MKRAELQEIASLRAVLERILRVMDESLFVDYQMEKFGQINYDKPLMIETFKSKVNGCPHGARTKKSCKICIHVKNMKYLAKKKLLEAAP